MHPAKQLLTGTLGVDLTLPQVCPGHSTLKQKGGASTVTAWFKCIHTYISWHVHEHEHVHLYVCMFMCLAAVDSGRQWTVVDRVDRSTGVDSRQQVDSRQWSTVVDSGHTWSQSRQSGQR